MTNIATQISIHILISTSLIGAIIYGHSTALISNVYNSHVMYTELIEEKRKSIKFMTQNCQYGMQCEIITYEPSTMPN